MKWLLVLLIAAVAGCGGNSLSGVLLSPDSFSLTAGESRGFEVSASQTIDLVASDTPPAGVSFQTEEGLGTRKVQMRVTTETAATPGTYRIRIVVFRHHAESGYVSFGENRLTLRITAAEGEN